MTANVTRAQMMDPMLVLERKQERAAERAARKHYVETPFGEIKQGKEVVMTREESDQVEELLMVWYGWAKSYRPALGAPRVAPYGRSTGEEDAYGEDSDVIDQRIDAGKAEQVEACMDDLHWRHRSAIGIHAANKAAGAQVFKNPRLSREEQHAAYQEAKVLLLPMLRRRSLIIRTPLAHSPKICHDARVVAELRPR